MLASTIINQFHPMVMYKMGQFVIEHIEENTGPGAVGSHQLI